VNGRRWAVAALVAVTCASVSLVYDHTRNDSFSADEPIHILSGYFEIFARNAIVNIEHPPLTKMLAGLALMALPLPGPPARVPMGNRFTDYGHAFLFAGPVSPDSIAAAARSPFLLVLAGLIAAVFLAARARYGAWPALFAAALVAFDPNIVAHAGVVHTDLGAALAFLLAVLAWAKALAGGWSRLLFAALSLGLALVTKFSCVYLLPILLLQGFLAVRLDPSPGRALLRLLGRFALAVAGALAIVVGVYAIVTARMDPGEQRQIIHEMVALRGAPALSAGIERIASFSPALGHYLGGLASVARQNVLGGGSNFLMGRISVTGFPLYFFVAFFAKSTLAFLILSVLVLGELAVSREARREAPLFLLPVGVLFLSSIGSSYNIGIRHMLPVYPFLALAGAGFLARRLRGQRRGIAVALAAALPVLSAVEIARIHPHELSYFNAFAGGPEGGKRILSDSNVDWGLDLKRLALELSRRGNPGVTVAYFGGDDTMYRLGVPDFVAVPEVRSRLIAVSAFYAAEGPAYLRYHGAPGVAAALERLFADLRERGRPAGRVGHSLALYELPAPAQGALGR
jgi:4-amino-4-deoxy-L-arabinose transferase-like glycosyltransferase